MLEALVKNAGIGRHLDAVLSVEEVAVFKPHPKVYQCRLTALASIPPPLPSNPRMLGTPASHELLVVQRRMRSSGIVPSRIVIDERPKDVVSAGKLRARVIKKVARQLADKEFSEPG